MRPLVKNPKRETEAAKWHREVFAAYGGPKRICSHCERPGATDAAHVIARAKLGPLRYADVRFGRPLHRTCHEEIDRSRARWKIAILREAITAHNKIAKVPIPLP